MKVLGTWTKDNSEKKVLVRSLIILNNIERINFSYSSLEYVMCRYYVLLTKDEVVVRRYVHFIPKLDRNEINVDVTNTTTFGKLIHPYEMLKFDENVFHTL